MLIRENTVKISITENGEESSWGSGFIIKYKNQNYIVSNFHVVGYHDGEEIIVSRKQKDKNDEIFKGALVLVDNEIEDLSILRVEGLRGEGFSIEENCNMFDDVISAGFPSGPDSGDLTVSFGKISNPHVKVDDKDRIKLDIGVNPGNSGGPLLNKNGEVLGVVYMKFTDNTGYAIPINRVMKTIDSIEGNDDKNAVKKIIESKLQSFMKDMIYKTSDQYISNDYFCFDFRANVDYSFNSLHEICATVLDNYNLDNLPGPENDYYESFLNVLSNKSISNNIFNNIFGKSLNQKKRLVTLGYNYIRALSKSEEYFVQYIEEQYPNEEERRHYIKAGKENLRSFYSKDYLNSIVCKHFGDIGKIETFEIVRQNVDEKDKTFFHGIIRIKYLNGYDNVKITMKYTRGRWAIFSIGEGILETEEVELVRYRKSSDADRVVKGEVVPYRFNIISKSWNEQSAEGVDYQFAHSCEHLFGVVLSISEYLPLDDFQKSTELFLGDSFSGTHIIHREQRIVNGTELQYVTFKTIEVTTNTEILICCYLYSQEKYGSVLVMVAVESQNYQILAGEINDFLNGLEI
ncbi:MAG: trypsin-like peptidase domain-containing protein [Spirochaetales bacterium]|nr:trypsin-like peptidase domain-containing protein [Spirochaetales bacterium]